MKDQNCAYCMEGELVAAFGIKICELESSKVYLFKAEGKAKKYLKEFNPDKVNYGAYGDTGHHLHFHLVPKYKDGYEWGGVFAMNPGEKTLSDEEYQDMVEKYRAVLCK